MRKTGTADRKKKKWDGVRIRLWIFGGLALLLVLAAFFAEAICPNTRSSVPRICPWR